MRPLRFLRWLLLVGPLACLASGCALVWGFQPGEAVPDEAGVPDVAAPDARYPDTGAQREDSAAAAVDAPPPTVDSGLDGQTAGGDAAAEGGCRSTCIPQAPGDWQGPLAIFEAQGTPPLPGLPDCEGASYSVPVYDGYGAPVAPPAACSCSCGSPTGGTCTTTATLYRDPSCSSSCGSVALDGTCANVTGCGVNAHFTAAAVASGGQCDAIASTDVAVAQWGAQTRLCAARAPLDGGGCDPGDVCAPSPSFPFEAAVLCVMRAGAWTCPGGYPAQRTYYESSSDTRGCSACSCGGVTGASCDGTTVALYSGLACTGISTSTNVTSPCAKVGTALGATAQEAPPAGGTCAPSGGQPVGAFQPASPTTLCCTR